MAKRFSGEFSPNEGRNKTNPSEYSAGWRVNLLFFAPLPLLFRAFFKDPQGLVLYLAAFGILILAVWLTRDGIKAQLAYEGRKVARRPAIPRKLFGSALTGIGLFAAGLAAGSGLFAPMVFGLLGLILHSFAFGIDPLGDKGMEGIDAFQTQRVARVVDEAEKHLAAMSDAILRADDRQLQERVADFQSTAREMFRTVEEDPRDLTAARKYLGVYLLGARDATVKFADIYARNQDQQARADYEALLTDLQDNFAARTERLLRDDREGLDVEIEVLRDRLQRDGINVGR